MNPQPDNTVKNILMVAAVFVLLAFLSLAIWPFMHGFMDSINSHDSSGSKNSVDSPR
jgi:hypothetical protein